MDLVSDSDDGDGFEWDSEGDGEAGSLSPAGSSVQTSRNLHGPGPSTLARLDSNGERDSGVAPSAYTLDYFMGMGFSREIVLKATIENGDRGEDSLLDLLLTYKEIGCNPPVDNHSSACVPHPVDDDDDILENWDDDDDANNSKDNLTSDDSGDECKTCYGYDHKFLITTKVESGKSQSLKITSSWCLHQQHVLRPYGFGILDF